MRPIIKQTITLPASADQLFDMYLDPVVHSAFTGHEVQIGREDGAPFQAFGGQLSGYILTTVKHQLIVQSWRSVNFNDDDPDSTLLLSFGTAGNEGQIDLVQLNVPSHEIDAVSEGWQKHYWEPWRAYLEE